MSYRSHTASEFLYKTETIRRMGGFVSFPVAYYSDYASICKFIKGSFLISTTEALVSFRMSGDNLSSCNRKNMEKTEALFMYFLSEIGLLDARRYWQQTLTTSPTHQNGSGKRLRDSMDGWPPNRCFRTTQRSWHASVLKVTLPTIIWAASRHFRNSTKRNYSGLCWNPLTGL